MIKQLAAQADERWKSIPSYIDPPRLQQTQPAIEAQDPGGHVQQKKLGTNIGVQSAVTQHDETEIATQSNIGQEGGSSEGIATGKEKRPSQTSPWADLRPKGAPSENWQPESWSPGVAPRAK